MLYIPIQWKYSKMDTVGSSNLVHLKTIYILSSVGYCDLSTSGKAMNAEHCHTLPMHGTQIPCDNQ